MQASDSWERRTLTVLFTDICDSTRLSRRMELEPYGDLFLRVESIWLEAAGRYGGLVSRMQGDGCMILFGQPRPGERDVIDAIDAALRIHRELGKLHIPAATGLANLRARSGIHTGVALMRHGSSAQGLFNVMGEAPNIAGTLEKYAAPGEVLVTTGSLKPYQGYFLVEPRQVTAVEIDLRDDGARRTDAAAAVHIAGRVPGQSRFGAVSQRGLMPLIGRYGAMQSLRTFLGRPEGEPGAIAVLTAHAGLGKTRILQEIESTVEYAAYHVLRGSCESYRETELLQPFVQMLRAELVSGHGGTAAAQIELAVARPDVEGLLAVLARVARAWRLLVVIDDWQWADDASRRVLQGMLDLPRPPRLVLAARPNPERIPWIPAALQVQVEPWSEAQTAQVARRWLDDADPLLIGRLHEYAGGVPLLVEELCHSNSAFRLWQTFEGHGTARDAGLKLLVAARLALLPRMLSDAVEAAAILGNELPRWLLDAICDAPLDDSQLFALADADFIYPAEGLDLLHFKHGITRDAVYERVGLPRRQDLHRRALTALQARVTGRHEALAALAYHHDGAGDAKSAAHFAEQAGDEALKAYAMDLARNHYRRAMDALDRVEPASPEQDLHWCKLACRFAMASVFDPLALGNDARVFEKAVHLAKKHGDDIRRAECLYWLGFVLYTFGRFREGLQHAREALALSERSGHATLASQVEATLGELLVGTGDYGEALERIDAALQAKRRLVDRPQRSLPIGSAYALACKGSVLADRGDFTDAQACFDESIALLGRSTHPVGNSVRNWICVAYLWQGQWERARHVATESMRIAENTGALLLVAVSRSTLGFARWCESGDAEGLQMMTEAVRWIGARRGRMFTSLHFGWLAEAYVAEGRLNEARPLVAHALGRARQGERLGEAVAARAMARAAGQRGRVQAAEAWLQRADRSARARASPREQALNDLARGQLLCAKGHEALGSAAVSDALSTIGAIGVRLPMCVASAAAPKLGDSFRS